MAKGAEFERTISKYLSVWLTGNEKPYQYWRMPGSGSIGTISEENKGLTGDIKALTPEAEFLTSIFSIELKNGYPATSFWQHFSNIKHFNVKEFWEQCLRDANKANKSPMLIYRKKGRKEIIGIGLNINDKLIEYLSELPSMTMKFEKYCLPTIVFYDFKTFFNTITPEIMKSELMGI